MTTFCELFQSVGNNNIDFEEPLSPSSYSSDYSNSLECSVHASTMEYSLQSVQSISCLLPNQPFLSIENERDFKQQIRFRYESEKGKHGGVKPIIKLNNYDNNQSNIYVKVSLYCSDQDEEHVFNLIGKECKDGIGQKKLGDDNIAKFSTLSICAKKRDEAIGILSTRKKENQLDLEENPTENKEYLQAYFKSIQNSVRFCFEAFVDNRPICEKIFSKPIYNQRNTGELKIVTMSRCSGKASGGDFMIILCDKISKDDTEIWFFEEDEFKNVIWQTQAKFQKADVHYQVAIPFNTPPYNNNTVQEMDKEVFIQLRRISDNYHGKPVKYTYLYDGLDFSGKRKREDDIPDIDILQNILEGDISFFSLPSETDIPTLEIEMDSIIIGNMAALDLTTSRKECISQQRLKVLEKLKLKLSSLLLNKENSAFLKLLPRLLTIQDTDCNSLLHLVVMEKDCDYESLTNICLFAPKNLVNMSNKLRMNPLHISTCQGQVKKVQILLQHGANPNLKNIEGNNCIHLAVKYNQPNCLEELLTYNQTRQFAQNINALNNEGLTPLHLAVMNEALSCVKILISHKALLNIPDGKSAKTALQFAVERNSEIKGYLFSRPEIFSCAMSLGLLPNPNVKYFSSTNKSKPTECCIEISEEGFSGNYSSSKNEEEKPKERNEIMENIERKLCTILDSNGLWKKLGLYIMDKNELDGIGELQDNPSKIILKEFKKLHQENFTEKLKHIMTNDNELIPVAQQLF